MNFWIEGKRQALTEVVKSVDVLLMDEGEARMFALPRWKVSTWSRLRGTSSAWGRAWSS